MGQPPQNVVLVFGGIIIPGFETKIPGAVIIVKGDARIRRIRTHHTAHIVIYVEGEMSLGVGDATQVPLLVVSVGGGYITRLDHSRQTAENVVFILGDVSVGVGYRLDVTRAIVSVHRFEIGGIVEISPKGFPGFSRRQIGIVGGVTVVSAAVLGLDATRSINRRFVLLPETIVSVMDKVPGF